METEYTGVVETLLLGFFKNVNRFMSDSAKRHTQTNRNNRTKNNMPHKEGSRSIATLVDEQAENGIGAYTSTIFILDHKNCKDDRPLDKNYANNRSRSSYGNSVGEESSNKTLQ
ncbi:hypothetical protein H5410_002944, partial [Solanum commersonii]